jgi:hypothetical protein
MLRLPPAREAERGRDTGGPVQVDPKKVPEDRWNSDRVSCTLTSLTPLRSFATDGGMVHPDILSRHKLSPLASADIEGTYVDGRWLKPKEILDLAKEIHFIMFRRRTLAASFSIVSFRVVFSLFRSDTLLSENLLLVNSLSFFCFISFSLSTLL